MNASVNNDMLYPSARLLQSLAEITVQRDIDALDHSLVLSLAELTTAHAISLIKRVDTDDGLIVETTVRCTRDAGGSLEVRVNEDDPRPVTSFEPLWPTPAPAGDGAAESGPLVVPVKHEGTSMVVLSLEGGSDLHASRLLVDGFARIYANYMVLLDESERDKLTGLYNRRTFDRHLKRLLKQRKASQPADAARERRMVAGSGDTPIWLAILDIDHFKRINDTYGHLYGDEVILLMARKMRECFRQSDVMFRFGGEEFVVLLDAGNAATAQGVLDRFRDTVASFQFPQVGHVTVSIGYARFASSDYPETVLDRADKALYFAKNHGRNRIDSYETLTETGELVPTNVGSIDLF